MNRNHIVKLAVAGTLIYAAGFYGTAWLSAKRACIDPESVKMWGDHEARVWEVKGVGLDAAFWPITLPFVVMAEVAESANPDLDKCAAAPTADKESPSE